jgi:hypothetical protein
MADNSEEIVLNPNEEFYLSPKSGVIVKINNTIYTDNTPIPESIVIPFIAKNVLRYELFIENTQVSVIKTAEDLKSRRDFKVIDIDDSNDTDIFVFENIKKVKIEKAIMVINRFSGTTAVQKPYSKKIIQDLVNLYFNRAFQAFIKMWNEEQSDINDIIDLN